MLTSEKTRSKAWTRPIGVYRRVVQRLTEVVGAPVPVGRTYRGALDAEAVRDVERDVEADVVRDAEADVVRDIGARRSRRVVPLRLVPAEM